MNSFDLQTIRNDFPVLARRVNGQPLVYLDNAATTLKPQSVIDAELEYYRSYTSNVHRGVHTLSEEATDRYESVREKARAFLNAHSADEIIFTRGATEAINLVAFSYGRTFLKAGDEIIISEMEHHSNIVPWQILCETNGCVLKVAPMDDNGEIIFEEYQKLFNERTRFVSLVYISNSLGTVNPIKKLIKEAHKYEAPVLVDAAQAVNHRSVDVHELNCDFLVFSGHKLFAPTGVGILYGKKELLNAMPPYQSGGDMIASVTFKKTTYNTLPYKFEAGTPNIAGVIGLGAAFDYVGKIGFDAIAAYEGELLKYGTARLLTVEGLTLIGTAREKSAILSFTLPDIHPHDIGTIINKEGIALRTGHHCTQPVMAHFRIPATSRASLAFYNTREEIDRLVDAVKTVKQIFS